MSISVTTVSRRAAAHRGGKFAISRQSGKNLWRRFGFCAHNDTGLAAPGERGERTVVPIAHRGGLVPSKPLSLNGLRLSFSKSARLRPRRNPPGPVQVEEPLSAIR
jgi:hypothetical protein